MRALPQCFRRSWQFNSYPHTSLPPNTQIRRSYMAIILSSRSTGGRRRERIPMSRLGGSSRMWHISIRFHRFTEKFRFVRMLRVKQRWQCCRDWLQIKETVGNGFSANFRIGSKALPMAALQRIHSLPTCKANVSPSPKLCTRRGSHSRQRGSWASGQPRCIWRSVDMQTCRLSRLSR